MKTMNKCKGIIYRADVQHCRTAKGVMLSFRLNKLKKKSCSGCDTCMADEDQLSEIDINIWPLIDIEKIKHGKLYKIEYCNMYIDYETGYADSWDLKVVEVNEEDIN